VRLWALVLLLSTPVLAADPPDEADEPDASTEPEQGDSESQDAGQTPRIPDPSDAARLAPQASPSERPRGVPDGWTEVPLEPESPEDDGADVIVWGTAATRAARSAVVRAFEEEGWEVRRRKSNGDIIFKGPEGWMGSARFSPDGLISFRRRLLSWSPVEPIQGPPTNGMEALDPNYRANAGTTRGGIQGPAGRRKVEPHRRELLQATTDELRHYRQVLAETALRQQLEVLPDRLDALWNHGQALSNGPAIGSWEDRRAEVLRYWATRPNTREGRLTMQVVEDWMAAVMQQSEHPATPQEIRQAEAQRRDGRKLGL